MLKNRFWNRPNALSQIVQTSIWCVVLDDRDAALWTVPLSTVDFDKAIRGVVLVISRCGLDHPLAVAKVVLPVGDPVNEHLPHLDIGNWNLFNGIDFQRWAM